MLPDSYSFVVIFEQSGNSMVDIRVPDLPDCTASCNDYTPQKALSILKAYEILATYLYIAELNNVKIPAPSNIADIKLKKNETAETITVQMKTFRAKMNKLK